MNTRSRRSQTNSLDTSTRSPYTRTVEYQDPEKKNRNVLQPSNSKRQLQSPGRPYKNPQTRSVKPDTSNEKEEKLKLMSCSKDSFGNSSNNDYNLAAQESVVKNEPDLKNEENFNDNDDIQSENMTYLQLRMKNMKDNEQFLASIGIFKAQEDLVNGFTKPKSSPSQRGLKRLRKDPVEILPRRKSLRISRIEPDGTPLPEPEPMVEEVEERMPEGPLDLKDCYYNKVDDDASGVVDEFCSFLKDKKLEVSKSSLKFKPDQSMFKEFEKMSLTEERVAKVVPGRVFSLDWHPSTDSLIAVAGDKYGHIGFWNVLSNNNSDSEMVNVFKPHVKPVSQLMFAGNNNRKLFSSSYDATLRCLDVEKSVFDEIFSVPQEDDDLLRDFSFVDPHVMAVAHFSGKVSVVDTRTPSCSAEHSHVVSKKSLQTVHVNPAAPHYFITAGADASISLWDVRHFSKKSPKSLLNLHHHSKTVSSAYFSPNGQQVLSCSTDDYILIYSNQNFTDISLSGRIKHNNCTGRWLTKFRPCWHPFLDNVFVSGSMAQPRRIEIYVSNTGERMVDLDSDNLNSVCSLNRFHPGRPHTLVGANSSGRLHVFM